MVLKNLKKKSQDKASGGMSPRFVGTGDNLSPMPERLSMKLSGRARTLVEDLRASMRSRFNRDPTHNEIVLYLFEHQINSAEMLDKALKEVEDLIKMNFSAEVYGLTIYLHALIKQAANGIRDPDRMKETVEKALNSKEEGE